MKKMEVLKKLAEFLVKTNFDNLDIVKSSIKNRSGTYGNTRKTLPQGERGDNF